MIGERLSEFAGDEFHAADGKRRVFRDSKRERAHGGARGGAVGAGWSRVESANRRVSGGPTVLPAKPPSGSGECGYVCN